MSAHCSDSRPAPANILEWLTGHLDLKLESLPDDRARVVVLAQQYGVWTSFYDRFTAFGHQPFGGPHPEYGEMTAWDFSNVLALIDQRRRAIERVAA